MFIFTQIHSDFGGPPYFRIKGLCGGFGYNSQLRVPTVTEVSKFPLIAGLTDPSAFGGEDPSPGQVLQTLTPDTGEPSWLSPHEGEFWLAAGIRFSTFELIDSTVLLTASFGENFSLNLLGISRAKFPKNENVTYANLELQIAASFIPDRGILEFQAGLTDNSYLFDPACKLSGGCAMIFWFGNSPYAGDFVITLGGYHRYFQPPAHYPVVPRLAINWTVDKSVSITGEAYFALTPSALMAGGALRIIYNKGSLKAWFTAHTDIIVWWDPFQFIAEIGVSIGASYTLDLLFTTKTFSVELGADLTLWGPPTGGTVTIHWWVISFTIAFGRKVDMLLSKTQKWDTFCHKLPKSDNRILFTIHSGLSVSPDDTGSSNKWLVRSNKLVFSLESTIPVSHLSVLLNNGESWTQNGSLLDIRPMQLQNLKSWLKVEISLNGQIQDLSGWKFEAIDDKGVPSAMWGRDLPDKLLSGNQQIINDHITGLIFYAPEPLLQHGPGKISVRNTIDYSPVDATGFVPLQRPIPPDSFVRYTCSTLIKTMQKMNCESTAKAREKLFSAILKLDAGRGKNQSLELFANNVNTLFRDLPFTVKWQRDEVEK